MSPRASLNRYIDIDIVRYEMYLVRTYKFLNCYLHVFSLHTKEKSTDKTVWKMMSLPQKVEVLNGGMRIATVGRHYGVNESTISFCSKNEDKIKGSVKPVVRRLR